MKKITLSLLLALMLSLAATAAIATPQYHGPTTAPSDFKLGPDNGFYIWNDENSPRNWSIRWYATDVDTKPVWTGTILFGNSTLDQSGSFSFTKEDKWSQSASFEGFPYIGFKSFTNGDGGIDGLDFTLTGGYELLEFKLGSSIFENTGTVLDDDGQKSGYIFIGRDFKQPNVLVSTNTKGMTYHKFEVKVPEPGTLALLGLGLLGLTLTRRRAS